MATKWAVILVDAIPPPTPRLAIRQRSLRNQSLRISSGLHAGNARSIFTREAAGNTKPKPRPSARQIQKTLGRDIDFYRLSKGHAAGKARPPRPPPRSLTALFEGVLSAREELAHAEAAVAAGKANMRALMELVNPGIAGLRPRSLEPVEPEPARITTTTTSATGRPGSSLTARPRHAATPAPGRRQ